MWSLNNFEYLVEKRKKQGGGQKLLLPIWIDTFNSHDRKYREKLQKVFYEQINDENTYMDGIIIYGMENMASMDL